MTDNLDAVAKATELLAMVKRDFPGGADIVMAMVESKPEFGIIAAQLHETIKKAPDEESARIAFMVSIAMVWHAMAIEQKRFAKSVRAMVIGSEN